MFDKIAIVVGDAIFKIEQAFPNIVHRVDALEDEELRGVADAIMRIIYQRTETSK